MYFKKLELVGFKSFCNKTSLEFEPGVTAVVGPNGCGKSNVFDSIRWVLGEQSVKAMRGAEMQDVIFNGTDSKEPLSMAEVTLTFDNSKNFFPVDHHEVAITRRIFRSGESEYLINKNQVRLKDILDILMGTGIGAESYSLVAQGKIDLVLSSKPEDRRLIFDEASGITKYKTQKREAMRKLEETEQNLLRLNDIVIEVKRQIGSLERQANKARRYKEIFEELKSKEINLGLLKKNALERQKDELINKLNSLEAEEARLLNAIVEQESAINNRTQELKGLQEAINNVNNQLVNLNNSISRNNERINLNQERIAELEITKNYLQVQVEQAKNRLFIDGEKLNNFKQEQDKVKKDIEEKDQLRKTKEEELHNISLSIHNSLINISQTKRDILGVVTKITNVKNESADLSSNQQILLARKKRLEIEKAKVLEEKSIAEANLSGITQELNAVESEFKALSQKVSDLRFNVEAEKASLNQIVLDIQALENEKISLQSQKAFLEELKTKYEGIDEAMNAVIYLDKLPSDNVNGLVVKIKDSLSLSDEDKAYLNPASFKLSGEAKPIDLDTNKINRKIEAIQQKIADLQGNKSAKEDLISGLDKDIETYQQNMRAQEIALVNKKAAYQSVFEQFGKIKEEEEIIALELSDVGGELSSIEEKINSLQSEISNMESQQHIYEETIIREQNSITLNNGLKEEALVFIAQIKTELDGLNKYVASEEANLKALEEIYTQDQGSLENLEKQFNDAVAKSVSLDDEIKDLFKKIEETAEIIKVEKDNLSQAESKYKESSFGLEGVLKKIENDKKELDNIKNKLYDFQMQNKEVDFKYLSIKERISQGYKVDLDSLTDIPQGLDEAILSQDIEALKGKIESYGTVNLVAIEEYDELKKRYDFLSQQQNDLITAKETLHEAILKINRTTRKMFMETFEKVREEFKNYFRLLFNGGEAQIYLIDEQDPLESGIEIICRPPGKKLQNILLLSGGEKSLSAIALIFAIFKIKPAPFCVLDEIDAALDEANVDRYSRALQEFTKDSQFIIITHNKKTIANANVMYGITMEESGVSKVVSVKFGQRKQEVAAQVKQPEPVV